MISSYGTHYTEIIWHASSLGCRETFCDIGTDNGLFVEQLELFTGRLTVLRKDYTAWTQSTPRPQGHQAGLGCCIPRICPEDNKMVSSKYA